MLINNLQILFLLLLHLNIIQIILNFDLSHKKQPDFDLLQTHQAQTNNALDNNVNTDNYSINNTTTQSHHYAPHRHHNQINRDLSNNSRKNIPKTSEMIY